MIFWAGKSSDDVRIVVERYPAYDRPAKKLETIAVPGRNGDLLIDQRALENYIQTYEVYISAEKPRLSSVAKAVAAWLYDATGYQRLEDDYDCDTFRLAYFAGPLKIENILNRFGRATIEFCCKPQRFLRSGEQELAIAAPGTICNPTGQTALPIITVRGVGAGTLSVGSVDVAFSDIAAPVILDCETQNAYSLCPLVNQNPNISAPVFPALPAGEIAITWSGGVTGINMIPRWWSI